jgi:ChrR Cupin-like domain
MTPQAMIHSDNLAWRPWDDDRKTPFVAYGTRGSAHVKVLSRDPKTGGESLMYRLEPGWSAERIENSVFENLIVYEGELLVDGRPLRNHAYLYRPEGHETVSLSAPQGATIVSFAGYRGEPASKRPTLVDVESMEWQIYPVTGGGYYLKVLRADEENLDTFILMRTNAPVETTGIGHHEAPEEVFVLEGVSESYDEATEGRHVATRGSYVYRAPWGKHGLNKIFEDTVVFKHDYFQAETPERLAIYLETYPRETPAVRALREGRDPGLPPRW